MLRKQTIILPILAGGHALNDLLAGYLLGSLVQSGQDLLQVSLGLFIYNLLAFGGQYPVALLLERKQNHASLLLLSYLLNIAAVLLFPVLSFLAVILAGAGSAIYHVAGGSVAIRSGQAATAGIFAAPGVAGLIAGGYLAYTGIAIYEWLVLVCLLFGLLLYTLRHQLVPPPDQKGKSRLRPDILPDGHDWVMIFLLTIISLRSAIWNVFQLLHENNYEWLIWIALAAVIGKIIGGWLADKIGWRLYALWSLFAAMPLITFFKKDILLFCIGIGLLQSGIPATTMMLIHSMKGKKERGVALSFGVAIIAGAILFYTPARIWLLSDPALWIVAVIMSSMLLWLKKEKLRHKPNR